MTQVTAREVEWNIYVIEVLVNIVNSNWKKQEAREVDKGID